MLKVRIGDESRIDMPLFFGFVGAFNVLLLWPVFPLLDWLGIETFQLPFTPTLWIIVLLNAFIGTFLSDYLWLLSMLMTSPLVVTLGISLTVIQYSSKRFQEAMNSLFPPLIDRFHWHYLVISYSRTLSLRPSMQWALFWS
jgi:hypothetical protein